MSDIEKAKDALKIAREALAERRGYCPQWEYKYGAEWDNEDGYINDIIAALEEKPAEDAREWDNLTKEEMWDAIFPI
jgi:hypothetical protein